MLFIPHKLIMAATLHALH